MVATYVQICLGIEEIKPEIRVRIRPVNSPICETSTHYRLHIAGNSIFDLFKKLSCGQNYPVSRSDQMHTVVTRKIPGKKVLYIDNKKSYLIKCTFTFKQIIYQKLHGIILQLFELNLVESFLRSSTLFNFVITSWIREVVFHCRELLFKLKINFYLKKNFPTDKS
jgi:hypothetical protein